VSNSTQCTVLAHTAHHTVLAFTVTDLRVAQ
jgi:hypothetical protein